MIVILTSLLLSLSITSKSSELEKELSNVIERVIKNIQNIDFSQLKKEASESDNSEIAEANQSQAAFTIATDKKPIVAAYEAGSGVLLGGYDETNKIAFIVHFTNPEEVKTCGWAILSNVSRLAKKPIKKPIQIHLRGGIKGMSEETITQIKSFVNSRIDLPMQIVSENILADIKTDCSKSLWIDSRTGDVAEYNPLENPNHKKSGKFNMIKGLVHAYIPQISIVYAPD